MTRRLKAWTTTEDRTLERLFPTMTNSELARLLGRTRPSVIYRGGLLGLRKTAKTRSRAARDAQASRRSTDKQLQAGGAPC